MAPNKSEVVAYADGSCIGNPGPGGWGVLIVGPDGSRRELCGADPSTTNNRMEITAAIQALRAIPSGAEVIVRSDSKYLVNTMTLGWRRRENLDLWRELDTEAARHRVRWEWVRGHAGDAFNERADELARNAALGRQVEASPVSSDNARADTDTAMEELRPLLKGDEMIRRCANCGRAFVASAADSALLVYCSLVACQLTARRQQRQTRSRSPPAR